MEITVKQRSEEWFKERKRVTLTASKFGDALGVGRGRPFDYLHFLLRTNSENDSDDDTPQQKANKQHGIALEPAISEAYQLLLSNKTRESGFWIPKENDVLHGLVGASPDGIVEGDEGRAIGLCEFKAPIFNMFGYGDASGRIPRHHMAQMQGQMAIVGVPWCDFLAVCTRTREIMLKRVYFQPSYWMHASACLHRFSLVLQEAKRRKKLNQPMFDFEGAKRLQTTPYQRALLPGEGQIRVENLLRRNPKGEYSVFSTSWFTFDFLLGNTYQIPPILKRYSETLLEEIDNDIEAKKSRKAT